MEIDPVTVKCQRTNESYASLLVLLDLLPRTTLSCLAIFVWPFRASLRLLVDIWCCERRHGARTVANLVLIVENCQSIADREVKVESLLAEEGMG